MSSCCKCKSYSHLFNKNIGIYAIFNDQNFNDSLTNDTVSFYNWTQECMIKVNKLGKGVSQYLVITKKFWNKRRSECLRNFKFLTGTSLVVLLILAGNIETNPGPRHHCGFCKKYGKASDK